MPEIVKTARAACGRIERQLRREYPEAAALMRPGGFNCEKETALSPAARDALHDLWSLGRVRGKLQRNYGLYGYEWMTAWSGDWPERHELPTSPEIERFFEIRAQAEQRWRDNNRERGRQLLALIDSGEAWQQQEAHMASVEKWLRDGPVIHRINIGTVHPH